VALITYNSGYKRAAKVVRSHRHFPNNSARGDLKDILMQLELFVIDAAQLDLRSNFVGSEIFYIRNRFFIRRDVSIFTIKTKLNQANNLLFPLSCCHSLKLYSHIFLFTHILFFAN
jgi:hypothetical protein